MGHRLLSLSTAHRAASVLGAPLTAGSPVCWMALWALPQVLLVAVFGNLVGRCFIVWMPLFGELGVCSHGLALSEAAALAVARWADLAASRFGQIGCPGFPLMLPPASMPAAQALEPDLPGAAGCDVCQLQVLVAGWMPPLLDGCRVWVGQRLLAIGTCVFARQNSSALWVLRLLCQSELLVTLKHSEVHKQAIVKQIKA